MPDADIKTLRTQLAQQAGAETVEAIRAAVQARQQARGGHTEWGLLCEEAGLMGLAFREFQLAMRDDQNDLKALARLAEHYAERGDATRAAALFERLLLTNPTCEPWLQSLADVTQGAANRRQLREALDRAVAAGLPARQAARLLRNAENETREHPDAAPSPEDASADRSLPAPSDADCIRFAALFTGREDVYAR